MPQKVEDVEDGVSSSESSNDKQPDLNIKKEKKGRSGCFWFSLVFVLLIFFMLSCGFISFIFFLSGDTGSGFSIVQEGSADQIAVVNVEGVISRGGDVSLLGGVSGAIESDIVGDLDYALSDPNVKAIILRIESPGGEAVASDIIGRKVLEVRERKPVIAYSSSMAASGGYMVAATADQFVVHPGTLTGSIGVIMQTSNMEGLYEKLGIQTVTFKSDRFKDNSELYDGDDEGEIEAIYQELVDESYEQFLDIIMLGRGIDETQLRELADGRIFSGKQAVENGLADSEGYFDDAVVVAEDLAGISNATIVEYSDYSMFGGLFGVSVLDELLPFTEKDKPFMGVYYLPDLSR